MGATSPAIHYLIRRAAGAYTAGPEIEDARKVCVRLAQDGIASSLCYWNIDADDPRLVSESYIDLIGLMSGLRNDCYLSVKAPALNFDLELLKNVLDRARGCGATVHFDSIAPEAADRTFDLIGRTRQHYPKIGCTLPGRWRRSLTDADRAITLGLRVRVVKGEWPGGADNETNPTDGFLDIVDRLAAGRARHVAVATHNIEVARKALGRLRTTGTSCELELLYGLPATRMLELARQFNVLTRMYVPYGTSGLPYRLKHAARNPRIMAWFLRDLLRTMQKN